MGAGCASSGAPPPAAQPRDRTDDPELAAARRAAVPEFETQADALAAGVYETFQHPDSVAPLDAASPALPAGVEPGPDPSTEELLGTLGAVDPYKEVEPPAVDLTDERGEWTLQLGAFESETGALVRIRQIASAFPRLPRWYVRDGERVRVFVGRFPDRIEAERERTRLAEAGYPDVWVTRVP
jgi:cell division protein FtsN